MAKESTQPKSSSENNRAVDKLGILEINKMQYVIKEGQTITVRISPTAKAKDVDVKLLGLIEGDSFEYGTPYLDNKLKFELGEVVKGPKVIKSTYKAKTRYRRKVGFRPKYVEFNLVEIAD